MFENQKPMHKTDFVKQPYKLSRTPVEWPKIGLSMAIQERKSKLHQQSVSSFINSVDLTQNA